jgi:hypothetical protein
VRRQAAEASTSSVLEQVGKSAFNKFMSVRGNRGGGRTLGNITHHYNAGRKTGLDLKSLPSIVRKITNLKQTFS